jgi:LacI family transcriptional regulator
MVISKANSIYKIAELAGVSPATVSKVINGRHDVSEEMCQKVRKIIQEQGYKPSVSKTGMDTIGVFIPLSAGARMSNPYLAGIVSGIGDTAGDSDLMVAIVNSDRIPKNPQEFVRFCRMRRISGGIFPLLNLQDDYMTAIAHVFPTVTISRDYGREIAGCVMADNCNGGYEATKYLVSMGHRKILLVNPSVRYPDHNFRMEGAMMAIEEAGLPDSVMRLDNSLEFEDADLGCRMDCLLAETCRPTAIFAASDQEALRIIRLLSERNIAIPEDISIVGFDDLYFAANTNPPLTTVRQPLYNMGREACMIITQMIKKKPEASVLKVFPTELILRKSVKAIKV